MCSLQAALWGAHPLASDCLTEVKWFPPETWDQESLHNERGRFEKVRDQFIIPSRLFTVAARSLPAEFAVEELLGSQGGQHSAAAACLIYEGEPTLIRSCWVHRCVIQHKHKPGKENFHVFWWTGFFSLLFSKIKTAGSLAWFPFPAKRQFHFSGSAWNSLKYIEVFAWELAQSFPLAPAGVSVTVWTWCDVPMAATWIIYRCCGRQTPRLPPPCHQQLFWRWKRLICNEASAPGFGTWMAWRHLLISSGLYRFSGRQWTMVSPSLRWWLCGKQSPPVVIRADFGSICCRGRHWQLTGAFSWHVALLRAAFSILRSSFLISSNMASFHMLSNNTM